MPPVKDVKELRRNAYESNFLNNGSPQYQTVNSFTRKLMDLREALNQRREEPQLSDKLEKFTGDLMTLQMHDAPFVSEERLSTAISDVVIDLPYYLGQQLPGATSKTGYDAIVEAGEKYGIFTRQEFNTAMNLVGQGMGMDMRFGEPARQAAAQAQPEPEVQAPAQPEPVKQVEDPGEKLYTDAWYQNHIAEVNKNLAEYRAQAPLPDTDEMKASYFLNSGASETAKALTSWGVLPTTEQEYPPEREGAPSVFIMKDGKVSTLKEAGLWIFRQDNGAKMNNPELFKAVMRGEIFAYLPGERHPVQLQADISDPARRKIVHSKPLVPGQIHSFEYPKEPALARAPRWYHRAFQFWGNNRKICSDYDASVAAHKKWEQDTKKLIETQSTALPESDRIAKALDDKFGALRTPKALRAELNKSYEDHRQTVMKTNKLHAKIAGSFAKEVDQGIDIAMNVYAAKPEIKKEWIAASEEDKSSSNLRLYTEQDFSRLTKADIDPASVNIGGKAVSEREFAALAMFGSLDPKIGMNAQKISVGDPAGLVSGLKADGYTQEQGEQIVSKSVRNSYTLDILHTEARMNRYFDSVNGGRKNAEEALKAYPEDKTKLAGILADAIDFAAEVSGTYNSHALKGDYGVNGTVKLCGEMIDMMERDPELKALTQQKFEANEKAFCEGMNKQLAPFAKNGKGLLEPREFNTAIKDIRSYEKFMEVEQKGIEADAAIRSAAAENRELEPETKKGLIKDVLKQQMVTALYKQQLDERAYLKHSKGPNPDYIDNGVNSGWVTLNKYTENLNERIMNADEEDLNTNAISLNRGSSLPGNAPAILISGMRYRMTEKAPVMYTANQPKQMEMLDRQAEQIMLQDGLDKLSPEELGNKFYTDALKPSPYTGNNMILRAAKLGEAAVDKQAEPELNKQHNLEVNQPAQGEKQEQPVVPMA